MTDKQDLGELLRQALDDIDEIGGNDRHALAQIIGRPAYDRMMEKPKTADLIDKWEAATPRTKKAATRTLAVAIARNSDRADLTSRIEREIGDAFDETPSRNPTPIETKKHAAAVNQKRNGQRVAYEKPNGVNLALLAKGSDVSKYIKARQNSRH